MISNRFRRRLCGAVALSCAATFLTPPVFSQPLPRCGQYDDLASGLSVRYGERPVAQGVTAAGRMLRVFVSGRGTWTILVVLPDGRACVANHGEGWQRTLGPGRPDGQPS